MQEHTPNLPFAGADPGFDEGGVRINARINAVAPRGVRGHAPPDNFNFMASEMRFPAFSRAIRSGLIALRYIYLPNWFTFFFNHAFVIRFYVQFRGFDRTTLRSAPGIHYNNYSTKILVRPFFALK